MSALNTSTYKHREEVRALECVHFPGIEPEVVRCSICIHGVTVDREPKPADWSRRPSTGLSVDPGDAIMEGIIEGSICPRCLTSRVPIGCTCNRLAIFKEDMRLAAAFLQDAPGQATELDVNWSIVESQHAAASTFKRAARRIEWDSDDERADVRRGLLEEFGVEPFKTKWFPPRISEETHLPV